MVSAVGGAAAVPAVGPAAMMASLGGRSRGRVLRIWQRRLSRATHLVSILFHTTRSVVVRALGLYSRAATGAMKQCGNALRAPTRRAFPSLVPAAS